MYLSYQVHSLFLVKHTQENYMPALTSFQISDLSDDQLITHFKRNGDKQVVAQLFQRYYHLIYGACYKQLNNREESKDATMNIFERMIIKLPTSEVKSFNSWIYVVIQNECRSLLRKRQSSANLKGNLKIIKNRGENFMESEGVARLNTDKEVVHTEERLNLAIGQLKKEQQECIRLFFFEQKSYEQIAKQTSYSEKQVKSYLQNGKRNIKLLMQNGSFLFFCLINHIFL